MDRHLRETVHVPGRLFSVGTDAVASVPRPSRNERLACHFDTDFGPMCVVMVGALLVSGWKRSGAAWKSRPTAGLSRRRIIAAAASWSNASPKWARFNYGSTAIVLLPQGVAELAPRLAAEMPVRLGQRLATLFAGGSALRGATWLRR